MTTHAEQRLIRHSPEQLFDLVVDVSRYPEFLPWCVAARINRRDGDMFEADVMIGFKMIREQFSSRLNAMSRTYSALSNTNWDGLLLSDIFEHELEQYGGVGSDRIKMTGPEVLLGPKSSQDGSMIIHELATNAAKYGCFSDPNGRLHVSWQVDLSAQTLAVEWSETGLSGITEPTQTGFGTQLTDFMPNIKVERVYRDEGLLVRTVVPLPIAARSALRNI